MKIGKEFNTETLLLGLTWSKICLAFCSKFFTVTKFSSVSIYPKRESGILLFGRAIMMELTETS